LEKNHKQLKFLIILILTGFYLVSILLLGLTFQLRQQMGELTSQIETLSRETALPVITPEYFDLSDVEDLLLKYSSLFKPSPPPQTAVPENSVLETRVSEEPIEENDRTTALNALSRSPYNIEALTLLGRLNYEEGNLESSLEYFSKVIEVDPTNREAWLTSVKSAYGMGEFNRAAILSEGLLNLEETAYHWVLSGKCLVQLEEYDRALSAVDQALRLDETNLDALEMGGTIYLAFKHYGKSEEYYLRAAEIRPQGEYFITLGELALFSGEMEQACEYWEKAAGLNPLETRKDQQELLELYEKMALCAYKNRDDKRLKDYFYQSEKLGGREMIYVLLLRNEKERGRNSEALKRAESFRKKYPHSLYETEVDRIVKWAKGV
jgi:tetratricopeptide (TPR) repeat protein